MAVTAAVIMTITAAIGLAAITEKSPLTDVVITVITFLSGANATVRPPSSLNAKKPFFNTPIVSESFLKRLTTPVITDDPPHAPRPTTATFDKVSKCLITQSTTEEIFSNAALNFAEIASMVPSCCHLVKVSEKSLTFSRKLSNRLPAFTVPSFCMPRMFANAFFVTPVTVENMPRRVVACFSMPPENLSSMRASIASLNFSWLTIWPLLLAIWTPANIFSPFSRIMALVMPNSFRRSSSPAWASMRASTDWSKLLLVAAAMSPA